MFKITDGRGVFIQFANGYGISIQWGMGNYCQNRDAWPEQPELYKQFQRELGQNGSATAEIAVMTPDGALCGQQLGIFDHDDVGGYCSPERVLEVMNIISQVPTKE